MTKDFIGTSRTCALSAILAILAAFPMTAMAEVNFPSTRNTVGPDELYLLDEFQSWTVMCLRDANSEDFCSAGKTITAIDHGLELDFSVAPFIISTRESVADVDVVPVAIASIAPYSTAKHYNDYSAAITAVDDVPFDGYWCPLTDDTECLRGSELARDDLAALLAGKSATVTIYDRASTPDEYTVITEIQIGLAGLKAAFERANAFNAEIYDIDLEVYEAPREMCDLYIGGIQKRISYTYDEDFEAQNVSYREALMGAKGGGSCPAYVTLAYLTPDMTPAQRSSFCLNYDKKKETTIGVELGEQDAYRVCKAPSRSMCQRVNDTKEASIAIATFATGSVASAVGYTTVTGTTVVLHSSGMAILTGSAGYVAGTLGTIGTTTLGILTAPVTATAAAVTVVAVGGAVYLCAEDQAAEEP